MLVLIEDFLSDIERASINSYFIDNKTGFWVDGSASNDFCLEKILTTAGKFFDLQGCVGVECWAHYNTRPEWHIDKDEVLHKHANVLATPLCSIVYYGIVDNLVGGEFVTSSEVIKPKQNSLLLFTRGIPHSVNAYTGTRLSLAINPWEYKVPLAKDYLQ